MGFMTEIGILNDCWDKIRKDPKKFVKGIDESMDRFAGERRPFVIGQTTVHPSHHADEPRVYLAQHNSFYSLDEFSLEHHFLDDPHHVVDLKWLDFWEQRVDRAIRMLQNTKRYIGYLKVGVLPDERPGGKNYERFNDHHRKY